MMLFRNIIFFIVLLSNIKADDILIKKVIEKTNIEYQKVKDFEAKMSVKLNVPGLRMPKKTYKVLEKSMKTIRNSNTLTNSKRTRKGLGYYQIREFLHLRKIILTT